MKILTTLSLLVLMFSCANPIKKAVNKAKYSAYEMVGVEKRDLFKSEVSQVKQEQEETGEAFKDALERLQEIYAFDGGDLEKEHDKLHSSYEEAKVRSQEVNKRITQLNTVANDLFVEWEAEISEISSGDLKRKSREKLVSTKSKYRTLHKELLNSEKKIHPVLAKLKDQDLYLKHNLNAKALGGLKTESAGIENEIKSLISEMNASSKKAQEFIETL